MCSKFAIYYSLLIHNILQHSSIRVFQKDKHCSISDFILKKTQLWSNLFCWEWNWSFVELIMKNHFGHKLLRHAYSIINTKSIFYWVFRSLLGIKKTVFRVLRFTGNDYLLEYYGQCFQSCKTGSFVYLLNNSNGYKTCTASIAHIFIHSHHYRMLRCFFLTKKT